MSATKKIYAAADFGRYHRGEMSAEEMHTIEKAALHDPFVADALEGYSFNDKPEEDIADLEQRLVMAQVPVVSIKRNKSSWWKIAAVVVLIAGLGYLVNQYYTNEKEIRIAETTVQDPATSISQDSVQDNFEDPLITGSNENVSSAQIRTAPVEGSVPQATSKIKDREDLSASVSSKEQTKSQSLEKAPENMPYTLQGKVVNAEGISLADASVSNKNDRLVTKTDQEGNYTLRATEAEVQSEIQVTGYGTVKQKLEANQSNLVVVSKTRSMNYSPSIAPNNAVVSPPAQEMNRSASSIALPVGGMDLFKNYIKDGIVREFDENGLQYIGTVKLSFELNENGRPKNIKVTQSLCAGCDKQAINLLKNGVPWTGVTGKTYETEIEF